VVRDPLGIDSARWRFNAFTITRHKKMTIILLQTIKIYLSNTEPYGFLETVWGRHQTYISRRVIAVSQAVERRNDFISGTRS